jgi:hypothetical protein
LLHKLLVRERERERDMGLTLTNPTITHTQGSHGMTTLGVVVVVPPFFVSSFSVVFGKFTNARSALTFVTSIPYLENPQLMVQTLRSNISDAKLEMIIIHFWARF